MIYLAGSIEAFSGENGNGYLPLAHRVDAVGVASWLDVNSHLEHARERHCCFVIKGSDTTEIKNIKLKDVHPCLK